MLHCSRWAGALAACCLLAAPAHALDPLRLLTQYEQNAWSSERGLPQDYVLGVAQTPDGYLWIGTEEGVARFDGVRFTVFSRRNTPAFTDHNVQAMSVGRDGSLWIGTRAGGAVRYRDGAFTRFGASNGLQSERILAFAAAPDGAMFIGTNGGGVSRVGADGAVTTFTKANGLSEDRVVSLAMAGDDVLWIGTVGGTLNRMAQGRIEQVTAPIAAGNGIVGLHAARDGSIWLGTGGGDLLQYRGGGFTRLGIPPSTRVFTMTEDRDGSIWVGTNGNGLFRIAGGQIDRITTAQGLANDVIVTIFEDREGSLWLGTGGAGLVRLRDPAFVPVGVREGLSHDIALALLEDSRGQLWAGTYGGGLNRVGTRGATPVPIPGLQDSVVYALAEGRDGALWIGTGDRGVARWLNGAVTRFDTGHGLAHNSVLALVVDGAGTVWAGTRGGISRFDGARWSTLTEPAAIKGAYVRAMIVARDGAILAGSNGAGLFKISGTAVQQFSAPDPLANFVRAIHEDNDGRIWLGTSGGGLNVLRNGKFAAITTREGLANDVAYSILDDGRGSFWMSCNRGVYFASRQELLAVADGTASTVRSQLLGRADGMRNAETNGGFSPAAARTRDGAMWFPTVQGVARLDAGALDRHAPISVAIESSLLNRQPMSGAIAGPVGAGDLEFAYTALTFANAEQARFAYRLDGFDDDWLDVGTRRVAVYTNLPPGKYQFRVRAIGAAGETSTADAVVGVELHPRFTQTPYFMALAATAAVFAVAGLIRWRVSAGERRERELSELVRRRTEQLQDANRQLEQLSLIDPLTQIANRRAFDRELDAEWRRARRSGAPLSLVLCDIDRFKDFNDRYGHQAGDVCLRQVAQVIDRADVRGSDHASRYGGEEFALILPDTDAEGATRVGERVRQAVAAHAFSLRPGLVANLMISVGVATASADTVGSVEELISRSDHALYRAKGLGGNRVIAAAGHARPAS
jgi:diguanylate cyclase (GGDEF)-like protein